MIALPPSSALTYFKPMDIDSILFLIAILNLIGDLYNILKFKDSLPRWMPWTNILALTCCLAAWVFRPEYRGMISISVLLVYALSIKLYTKKRSIGLPRLPAPATKLLVALNVLSFGYQLSQNAVDDPYNLIRVGALYSPLVERGEWWRLLSAQFVHWGIMHLFFNALGLWFLGPLVENALGFFRYIITYLTCGVGGMLIAWTSATYLSPHPHPIILLGASASVLGLVGVHAALALRMFRRSGSLWAKAQLASMIQIIVLQAIFDFMVPQVSSTAHVGGAGVGFLLGMFLLRPKRR